MTGREAVTVVARREVRERVREKSFLVSTAVNVAIIVGVIVVTSLVGGGGDRYTVGVADPAAAPVARAAADAARAADVEIEVRYVDPAAARAELADGTLDAVLTRDEVRVQEDPPDELATFLQGANRQARALEALRRAGVTGAEAERALSPPPLRVASAEPVDEDDDARAGLAFFIVLLLYGQLLTYGYWVAAGVVEEKASRVVEVVLSTIRPAHLLAGKVIGLGLLGLGSLLLTGAVGLATAGVTGALDIDGDVLTAVGLALVWFVVGYAFYACAFACAGALVPRQEELQSSMTPLTLVILVSFFMAFAVRSDPDGTLAQVTTFVPFTAPMTMPPRIVAGDVAAWEIAASFAVTVLAAAVLIPLAVRIYSGGVLRTGSALKLREAWRAASG
jgi:ABC-2 type transport system permease protein